MQIETGKALRINAPEWYQNEEFVRWINSPSNTIATWHKPGSKPNEWSDLCVLVDPGLSGEGSDESMPEAIWSQIISICRSNFSPSTGPHITVWISNVAE